MINKRKFDDKWILAMKPYSNVKGDNHLCIVFAYLPTNSITPYVTWVYNNQDQGFFWGHYHRHINEAIPEFMTRGTGTAVYDEAMIKSHDAIECHYCNFLDREGGVEECDSDHAQLISVYLHKPEGGIEWITDHFDGKDAARIIRWISNRFELPVIHQPDDLHYIKLKPIN